MKFSSLVALKVVKVATSSATSDENAIKMTFPFQCCTSLHKHVMYAYLTFNIVDWYKSVFGIRCLLFWNNRTNNFYLKSLCNGNIIKGKCVKWEITEGNCTYTYIYSIMIYWQSFTIQKNSGATLSIKPYNCTPRRTWNIGFFRKVSWKWLNVVHT